MKLPTTFEELAVFEALPVRERDCSGFETDGKNWISDLAALCNGASSDDGILSRASHWPTCACGQLCARLPRMVYGAPMDFTLRVLGVEFYDYIGDNEWDCALDVFKEIEARVSWLLIVHYENNHNN